MFDSLLSVIAGVLTIVGGWFGVAAPPVAVVIEDTATAPNDIAAETITTHVETVPTSTLEARRSSPGSRVPSTVTAVKGSALLPSIVPRPVYATAIFAGGCFWSTEAAFEKIPGVIRAVSGYTGGTTNQPTYSTYASSGYREAVQVTYDPSRVSYAGLVESLLKHTDPTDAGGTFFDRGDNYRAAIYYATDVERATAEQVIREIDATHAYAKPVVAPVLLAQTFWPAEEYHQDYAKNNPEKYERYRIGSGRAKFIDEHWGAGASVITNSIPPTTSMNPQPSQFWKRFVKPSDDELKQSLSALSYRVTQHDGTEPPFANAYHDSHEDGIYVDIVSGEPLFSSQDKYDSGTGWPSFTKPLVPQNIVTREDRSLFSVRTEVRSKYGDSHLGHVFNDGPAPTGLRYCMNAAALRFVPKDRLGVEGYSEFASLFE